MSLGNDNYLQRGIVADYATWPRWKRTTFWILVFLPHTIFPGFILVKIVQRIFGQG